MLIHKVSLGSISHGTLRNADLLPTFLDEAKARYGKGFRGGSVSEATRESLLETVRVLDAIQTIDEDAVNDAFYDSEYAASAVEELTDLLGNDLSDFVYFGTHQGDGSDFGYWFDSEMFERMRAEGEIIEIDGPPSAAEKREAKESENAQYFASITDHGNVTIYTLTGKEVIAVV